MAAEERRCKYHEVCGKPGNRSYQGEFYCILHWPDTTRKDPREFEKALSEHRQAGHCDFRHFVLPGGMQSPPLEGTVFKSAADFSHLVCANGLGLSRATFEGDLTYITDDAVSLDLRNATVGGKTTIKAKSFKHPITLEGATFSGPFEVSVEAGAVEIRLPAEFHGSASFRAGRIVKFEPRRSQFHCGLTVQAQLSNRSGYGDSGFSFNATSIAGVLDMRQCVFDSEVILSGVEFEPGGRVDFSGARISGDLILADTQRPPVSIDIDGAVIKGKTFLAAPVGSPRLQITARTSAPKLGLETTFSNVDLAQCCLLGNVFQHIDCSDVQWHWLDGRWALYDEVVLRASNGGPVTRLREAYQILKERYKTLGDHVRSGDFHYGEMEMTRAAMSHWWQKYLGLAAWYCYTSGYGQRPLRAFVVLLYLMLAAAIVYRLSDAPEFSNSVVQCLRFSVAVGTLQRPELSLQFSNVGQWVYRLQAVVCPIQIALFGLAVRMRLRR